MDLELCVICGQGSGAESNLKNGLEIYHNFLLSVKEFAELQSMPVPIYFNKEDTAETFMDYKAKWHKSCHLKFAQFKLNHLKDKLSKKRKLEETECEEQRKSKRMSTGTPSQSACIFCSQDTGKLHACLTMNLDYDFTANGY